MSINKWVLLLLVSCVLQSNCMKRKLATDIENETDSNKKILLEVQDQEQDINTQLIKACQKGDLNEIIKFFNNPNLNPNITDENGNSPLINNIVYLNPPTKENETNRLKIAKYLIEKGTDINLKNKFNQTALIYAIHFAKNLKMVNLLLKYGANCNFESINTSKSSVYRHMNPLTYAIHKNHLPITQTLIDHGASLDLNHIEELSEILFNHNISIINQEAIWINKKAVKMLIWNGAQFTEQNTLYINRSNPKFEEIYKKYKNKINKKYKNRTKCCEKIITKITNLPVVLIDIINDYYIEAESDIQSKREILINDILYSKVINYIQNSTNLPNNISEIITNYSSVNSTDLENYCNKNI